MIDAANPYQSVPCSKAPNSAVCKDKDQTDNPISGPHGILVKITRIIAYIAGIAAIIMLIVGGIKYIFSGGDPAKVESAKSTIVDSLIGIAIIVLGSSLIVYVIVKVS